jgi:hypothetical protein
MNQTKIYIGILFLIISTTKLLSADKTDDFIFRIHPAKNDHLYIDVKGWHYSAEKKGSTIQLYEMDNGIDRLIKVIPCPNSPRYVYLQPMHSNYIMGLDRTSGNIKLMDKIPQKDRMFELIPVMGKKETYNIKIDNKFIDAEMQTNGLLETEHSDKKRHSEWVFKQTSISDADPYPIISDKDAIYRLRPANNTELSIDIPGFNSNAGRYEAEVKLFPEENPLGADRYIKIKQCPYDPEYVFIQPQHSDFVFDVRGGSSDKGTIIQLYNKGLTNSAQMFKPVMVINDSIQTYALQSKVSGLYLTANGSDMPLTQEEYTGNSNQQWMFDKTELNNMAPPGDKVFAIQNIGNNKYLDLTNDHNHDGAKLMVSSYSPENRSDGYHKLNGSGTWKTIQPMHSTKVLDVVNWSKNSGTNIILYKNHSGDNQKFKFIPTGEAMTFYIINKNSNMALGYNYRNELIQTYFNRNDSRQKWKLHQLPETFHIPNPNQEFYIKCAFSDKYWDLSGSGNHTNHDGNPFQIYDLGKDDDRDRRFKFKRYDNKWVFIEVQNGGKLVNVRGRSGNNGAHIDLYRKHNGGVQRFAIQVTSPTFFVLRTQKRKTVDVRGGDNNDGNKLIQYDLHYGKNQQFQLVYANGPKKGQVYEFFNKYTFIPNR